MDFGTEFLTRRNARFSEWKGSLTKRPFDAPQIENCYARWYLERYQANDAWARQQNLSNSLGGSLGMAEKEIFDVFLSHARPDAETVEKIGVRLEEEATFKVWLDKWVLIPGERWQQEMARGLNEAKTCAVCIGDSTPKSWFREEIEKALNRQTKDQDFRVIPVILPGGDSEYVEDFLKLRTWVEFRSGTEDPEAFHRLICGVRGVPPGRFRIQNIAPDATLVLVQDKLAKLKHLRQKRLIDDDIALEAQRRLMDILIDEGGLK